MENFIHSVICFIAIVIIDNGIDKNICSGKRYNGTRSLFPNFNVINIVVLMFGIVSFFRSLQTLDTC